MGVYSPKKLGHGTPIMIGNQLPNFMQLQLQSATNVQLRACNTWVCPENQPVYGDRTGYV